MHLIRHTLSLVLLSLILCCSLTGCVVDATNSPDQYDESDVEPQARHISAAFECADPGDPQPYLVCHINEGICFCTGEASCDKLKANCDKHDGTYRPGPDGSVVTGSCQF